MVAPVIASDITVENSGFSNANIAVTLPSGFVPAAGMVYDVLVNLAVPVSMSGATMTLGGTYTCGRTGAYMRYPALQAPFVLRARYLGGPERYAVISMRRLPWTMCA